MQLTIACPKCKGVGAPWNNSASVPCDDCAGTGRMISSLEYDRLKRELAEAQNTIDSMLRCVGKNAANIDDPVGAIKLTYRSIVAERERAEKAREGIIQIGMAVGVHDASSVEQILEDVAAIKGRAERAEAAHSALSAEFRVVQARFIKATNDVATLTQERDSLIIEMHNLKGGIRLVQDSCTEGILQANSERDAHAKTIARLREALAEIETELRLAGDRDAQPDARKCYQIAEAALAAPTTEGEQP